MTSAYFGFAMSLPTATYTSHNDPAAAYLRHLPVGIGAFSPCFGFYCYSMDGAENGSNDDRANWDDPGGIMAERYSC
jgi:hypothetical protein